MDLTFNDFKERAKNQSLSKWEKIGFPDSYRKNTEKYIFEDIASKLHLKADSVHRILDIGCGCSNLVKYFIEFSKLNTKKLLLIDSKEMLEQIQNDLSDEHPTISVLPGCFPNIEFKVDNGPGFDAIVVYSVIQYPFLEQSIYSFIHKCVDLLSPGGRLLIGDIPNLSSRNRFIESKEGALFQDMQELASKEMNFQHVNSERIDDAVVFSILSRYRNYGCETFLLPQNDRLPFANRREDILIVKR
jgi:cyclopropane fatty-acyl-phospholipid synthase-like methyltransferase